ncbi:proteasome-type protease [Hahella aquimaris]|uniref:proteasome-type protease n=1 Tax=Hahella sp. HNIBRBA332 TaxID=3015983 RepID=UPI00273B62EE|nr:proteasome-type protease [Hahella sp. HNIBRBA332]WLQ12276.1 proteasome-type protease [Hahella sp. HNIBRBA332]
MNINKEFIASMRRQVHYAADSLLFNESAVVTYCLAISVDAGLVFASDSRTNAGVDNVNTYPKMYSFNVPEKAFVTLLTSGNLATTQAVVRRISRDLENPSGEGGLAGCNDMSDAARYIGALSVELKNYYEKDLKQGANFDCTLIVGGQYKDGPHEILMVYPEGNYIQSSPYAPYLQIGETKYGKPILDRVIRTNSSLEAAARCALVSMDSTMRSNLSVAPPFDLLVYETGKLEPAHVMHLKLNSPYYATLRKQWGEGLKALFNELPLFEWEKNK